MVRLVHLQILFASLLACGAMASAQPAPLRPPATAGQPEANSQSPTPKRRAISPEVAAQLSANTPKYAPPAPKPPPKREEELPDMREVDKPKNTIIRLPEYIVREQKPVILNERAVHTRQGLADLAVRRYISDADRALNRYTLPLFGTSVEQRALMMYEEEERLRNMAELADNAAMVSTTDKAAGLYVKREAQKTYLRSSDFGWQGGNP